MPWERKWPARVKSFPPKESSKTPPEVLVIDFADSYQQKAQQDAEKRVMQYRRQGMEVNILHAHIT